MLNIYITKKNKVIFDRKLNGKSHRRLIVLDKQGNVEYDCHAGYKLMGIIKKYNGIDKEL